MIQRIQTLALLFKSAQSTCNKCTARVSPTMLQAAKLRDSNTDRLINIAAIPSSSMDLRPSKFNEIKVLLSQSADAGVTVTHVSYLYIYSSRIYFEKSATI